jgi:hypothetical protein
MVTDRTKRIRIAVPRRSVAHLKRRRVFRLHFAPIIDSSGGDVGVAERFLNLGNVGVVIERVGGGGGEVIIISAPDCA